MSRLLTAGASTGKPERRLARRRRPHRRLKYDNDSKNAHLRFFSTLRALSWRQVAEHPANKRRACPVFRHFRTAAAMIGCGRL
jgi:hypothetical protein